MRARTLLDAETLEMKLSDKQLIDGIKSGKHLPVYLLTGEENYFIDKLQDYLEENVVDEMYRDFDQTVVYGRDVTMTQVVGLAKQFPMMSPTKLVMVKEAQNIETKYWDPLADYLANPSPQTVLVLCYRNKSLDKRIRAYKAIDKVGGVCEHKKLYDSDIIDWVGSYANQCGYQITQRASALIAESIGNDLSKITNEMGKLFISIKPGDTINEDLIERNIGISKDYNVFELQNAIGRRDVVKCNRIINHFAANPKDNPIQMVIPLLYKFILDVMIYHQLENKREAASVLKINNFFVKNYEVAAQNYSLGKLASCIGYLNEADLRSKGVRNGGTVTDGELLKELIFKIIH